MRLARAAGVAIVGGTDFGGGSARANQLPWEVESLVKAGLEPWEALAAVTWRGGDLLGEPEAGVIREGAPPTSRWFTVTRSPTRRRYGESGASPDPPGACCAQRVQSGIIAIFSSLR